MVCRINRETYSSFTDNTMIRDIGTSYHFLKSDEGMEDVKEIDEKVARIG